PLAPNPESTLEYFNSSPGFVYGNRCLAPTNQLTTKIIVNTTVSWSFNSIANSTTNVIITNPGTLSVSNLGFAGAVELPNSTYAISNAYNTESYIFKSPPSDNASGIWSWNFEFVNFSKLTSGQIASLSQKQREFPKPGSTFPYLQYYNSTNGCTYNYTYSESVDFKGISNEKIPIPINLNKLLPDRIVFNNGTKAETSNAQRAGTGCAQWLFWNGAFGHSGSPCSFGVTNVDEDAAFYLSNSLQPGPTGASGYNYAECYGLLGLASNPTDCNGGSNVYTANDVVNGVNKYANDYIVATVTSYSCDVFFTCYNYEAYVIPSSQLQFKNVSAIPYLLYNFSAPATTSDVNGRVRYLNESYDLYSPHNYLNPNSLDQFTLGVGESMFATIINSTGSYFVEFPYSSASTQSNTVFSDPNPDFVSALNSSQQASETSSSNPLATLLSKPIGLFKSGNIRSPSYAVSTPNDYVYIINHTTSSGVFNTNTKSYIYTVRMIPYGYYNLTNLQPNFAVNAISSNSLYPTNSSWYDAWVSYWKDSLAEQSQNYYITNLTEITDSNTYACLSWTFSCVNGKDASFKAFIPTYVTSDYADDIFLAGLDTAKNNDLELAAYFSNNSAVSSVISPSNDAGFKLPQDLAATPGGQYIYLSNYSYPNILLFSSNSLAYYGNFSLSYSNPTYNMNITSYLAHGGPFGSSKIASAYANAGNTLDVSSNHHPVAIFDYNNLLYVVDDWSFTVNGLPSSILMLRVFLSNGTEIPINGANYNDLVLNSSAASSLDLNVQNASSKITNPPYGWPISANISISSSDTVSYCAALCTYSPSSTSVNYNGYLPIGPFITALGMTPPALNATGFYIDYNGTVYMISHVILPNGQSCSPATRFGPGSCTPNYKGLYTEFLRFKPLVENYTKIALASYSPYDCLINVSATSSPCTNNPYLSDLYPPFTVNPSPIKFVLGEGSASNYYDAASLSSSLFPGGLSSYSSGYSSTQQSNINSESSSTALSNSLVTSSSPIPTIPCVNNAKFITLTSTVGGYALIPYNASYTITKSWNLISTDPSGCTNVLPKSTTLVYNGIAVLQVNATPSSANTLVEGGPTYIKDLDSNNFYNANLSDNNSIISPSTAYALFTNRLLGAITINRTENRNGVLSAPQIINYTRLYNYSLYDIVQSANGKEYPGYAYSNVILANISSTPPSNVPVYGVANSLISNPNIFPGSNILEYANSSTTESVNIFQEFTYFKYYDLMSLSYPNDGQILGYNRLIYKLQDAFNNTVYAPIDVDIANTTIITLNINPVVNALNANQTQLNITGTAGYISGLYTKSFSPLPPNSQIYLYYDNPLEYYNATESPVVSSEASAYYRYALNCTFGDNPGQGCQFANPIDTLQQGTAGAVEADNITYHAQFNNTDVCPQPSKKGLLNATIPIDCSIYNDTAVVAPNAVVGNIPAAPYWRFCQPDYINGTGSLTSQIGLAAIVKTNNTGGFSSNTITACGSGTAQVIAKYFGGPGPEPVKYSQPAISNSISLLSSSQPYVTTYEYNYTVAPNETTASFSIGSYYLSMGKIGIIATILAIGAVLAYQISSRRNGKKSNKRASKGAPR
ncbi:MAG: hypothetical protein M1544_00335, partial [Candidatus Marsarchaeota archaeon]|nr:hypothetical protein [Candidatus Marsarchaeota archaeon]